MPVGILGDVPGVLEFFDVVEYASDHSGKFRISERDDPLSSNRHQSAHKGEPRALVRNRFAAGNQLLIEIEHAGLSNAGRAVAHGIVSLPGQYTEVLSSFKQSQIGALQE